MDTLSACMFFCCLYLVVIWPIPVRVWLAAPEPRYLAVLNSSLGPYLGVFCSYLEPPWYRFAPRRIQGSKTTIINRHRLF